MGFLFTRGTPELLKGDYSLPCLPHSVPQPLPPLSALLPFIPPSLRPILPSSPSVAAPAPPQFSFRLLSSASPTLLFRLPQAPSPQHRPPYCLTPSGPRSSLPVVRFLSGSDVDGAAGFKLPEAEVWLSGRGAIGVSLPPLR